MSTDPQYNISTKILIGGCVSVVGIGIIVSVSFIILFCTVKQVRRIRGRRESLRRSVSRRQVHARNDYFSVRGDFKSQTLCSLIEWNSLFDNNPYCVDVIDM